MAKTKNTTASARKKKADERKKANERKKEGGDAGKKADNKRMGKPLPTQASKKAKAAMGSTAAPPSKNPEEEEAVMKTENPGKGKGERPQNFLPTEDVILCKAFVSTTEDSIKGADQDVENFWGKVREKWSSLMLADANFGECFAERTWKSLRDRFQRQIAKNVSYFNKYYKKQKAEYRTGWVEDTYIKAAVDEFEATEGKPFKFTDCVSILHSIPKFSPDADDADANPDINNIGGAMGSDKPRPMGAKEAKKQLNQQKSKNTSTVASLESMKIDQLSHLAQASKQMATALNRKQQKDSLMNMAKLYMEMGDTAMAKQLMEEMKNQLNKEKEEDEKLLAEEKNDSSAPVDSSAPMSVVITKVTKKNNLPSEEESNESGHIQTAREKAITDMGNAEEKASLEDSEEKISGSGDDSVNKTYKKFTESVERCRASKDDKNGDSSSNSGDTADKVVKMATQQESV